MMKRTQTCKCAYTNFRVGKKMKNERSDEIANYSNTVRVIHLNWFMVTGNTHKHRGIAL